MKKTMLMSAMLTGILRLSFAQTPFVPAMVTGVCHSEKTSSIKLYSVKEGKLKEYGSTALDANNSFAFAIASPVSGYYYLATVNGDKASRQTIRLYLQPGEQAAVDIADTKGNYKLVKGGAENQLLDKWHQLSDTLAEKMILGDTSTYLSFFPALERLLPVAANFKKNIHTKNKDFNHLLSLTVDADIEVASLTLLASPRTLHPERSQYPAYYDAVSKPGRYCNTEILQLGDGVNLLQLYVLTSTLTHDTITTARKNFMPVSITKICNDTLKGIWAMTRVNDYKSLEKLDSVMKPYEKYFLTAGTKQAFFDARKTLSTFKKGTVGYNFAFPNTTNDTISMASLKGNVVVVDMWATWCGPCKAEIPFLQELEEKMKDKKVAFVSISVDEAKDKEKWLAFVKEKQLGGIQLFSAGWTEMAKFYSVTGIPRFMVFDKQGNIVTVDAPRPSTPELKTLIEEYL